MRVTVVLPLVLATSSILAAAEVEEGWQRFAGETTVNVIEVPVRVIDPSTGAPVAGLAAADFRILENGVEQRISNFSEISRGRLAGPADTIAQLAATGSAVSPVIRPLEVVYFFDLYLMYQGERDRALEALRARYRSGVPDGESVSVVAFDGTLETLLDRSDYRDDILEALDEIPTIMARGPEQRIQLTDSLTAGPVSGERNLDFYERRQRSREYVFELERKVGRVGEAILAAMARHARAPGRKVLVAFTPGYPRAEWSPEYAPVDFVNASVVYPGDELWQELAEGAADLGFTLFTIDSSGVQVYDQSLNESTSRSAPFVDYSAGDGRTGQASTAIGAPVHEDPSLASVDPNAPESLGPWLERNRKDLLISASQATGGEALFPGEVAPAIASVATAVDHYYSLAFTADHIGDGATYRIEVELPGHREYRLVHRTAYIDQPAAVRSAQRLRSEMLFGEDANPLGVRVEVAGAAGRFRLGAAGAKRIKVPIHIKIPYARLEMVPRGDLYWGKVVITLFGQDAAANQSQLASFSQPITVAEDLYQEAVARGYFSYQVTVEIEGGQQLVYVGIEDTISGRTSIVPHEFEF